MKIPNSLNFNRRNFLVKAGSVISGYALAKSEWNNWERRLNQMDFDLLNISPEKSINDEQFWYQIRMMYTVSPNIINLNNGGVCPQPLVVQEAVERYNRLSNEAPSYYMWRILSQGKEPLRAKLASLAGVSEEEIAINRNASEGLETVIFGLRLKRGDEVILAEQDYPNMMNAWRQRAHREGIELKWLNFKFPIENPSEIVAAYESMITPKTKVIHITHVINWMGQIMPVREIADMAKKRNIEVIVDGAHSFAHLDFSIAQLNCDYFGTSLHKWLSAPFGSGMLYVRKEKIKNLYPLFSWTDPESEDIRKFESLGTRSLAIEQAIGQAADFHAMIGIERKQARLHYLKNYWAEQVAKFDGVTIGTSLLPEFGCAIGLLQIDGMKSVDVSRALMGKYKIHTVAMEVENISGVRITPNVYTVTKDLDRLIMAVEQISKDRK